MGSDDEPKKSEAAPPVCSEGEGGIRREEPLGGHSRAQVYVPPDVGEGSPEVWPVRRAGNPGPIRLATEPTLTDAVELLHRACEALDRVNRNLEKLIHLELSKTTPKRLK